MKKVLISFLVCVVVLACGEKEYKSKWNSNPNGDSGLALLMREMFDETMNMKLSLEKGKRYNTTLLYDKLLTAQATEPHKAASKEYKAFAKQYIQQIDIYRNTCQDLKTCYKNMVTTCIGCHEAMCPGPLVKIDKLKLKS